MQEMKFDLQDIEKPIGKLSGTAFIDDSGQLMIQLNGHGLQTDPKGSIICVYLDMGIARISVFGDIQSEEPTVAEDLDGALVKP